MTKLTKRDIKHFAGIPTALLLIEFDAIEHNPCMRTKSGSHVMRRYARHGDKILAEVNRRREASNGGTHA
jgi:hypothetical protein